MGSRLILGPSLSQLLLRLSGLPQASSFLAHGPACSLGQNCCGLHLGTKLQLTYYLAKWHSLEICKASQKEKNLITNQNWLLHSVTSSESQKSHDQTQGQGAHHCTAAYPPERATCNPSVLPPVGIPSPLETEAGGWLWVWGHSVLYSEESFLGQSGQQGETLTFRPKEQSEPKNNNVICHSHQRWSNVIDTEDLKE